MAEKIDFKTIDSINENRSNQDDPFQRAISETMNKLKKLMNNSEKYRDSNILKNVIDNNMYVASVFKNKKLNNKDFIFIPKFHEERINSLNSNIFNSNTNINSIQSMNSSGFKSRIFSKNSNSNINFHRMDTLEEALYKKSNEKTKIIDTPNKIEKTPPQDKLAHISGRIQNTFIENINKLNNINANITTGNNKFLGNKRNHDNIINDHDDKLELNNIYNEIKELYDKYIKNKDINQETKIYNSNTTFYNHHDLIIIEGIPNCIIYFNKDGLTNIYLISDERNIPVENTKEIKEALNKIKNDLSNLVKKHNMNK